MGKAKETSNSYYLESWSEKDLLKSLSYNRKNRGFTQKQVQEQLGFRKLMIYDYESGRLKLPVEHAVKLANLYHCSIESLMGLEKSEFVNSDNDLIKNNTSNPLRDLGILANMNHHLSRNIFNDSIIVGDIGLSEVEIQKPLFEIISENLTKKQKHFFSA